MTDYQVPKKRVAVVAMLGGESLSGAVFLSERALSYTGEPLLEDFLNSDRGRFFPFESDEGGYSLVNREQLIYLESPEGAFDPPDTDLLPEPSTVTVFFSSGDAVQGEIYPDLPQDARRVSDYFNQEARFLPMYRDRRKIIVNTAHVLYVRD